MQARSLPSGIARALPGIAAFSLFVASAPLAAQQPPIRGFPEDALAHQASLERRAKQAIDPSRIRASLRAMTAAPHVAGTPGSRRVAEWALARFREWGLDAAIEEYEALLPFPIDQRLSLEAGAGRPAWHARLREEVFAEDPDSKLPGILPPYAMYGADGDVRGEVVYANYALPEDFAQLDRLGVDVRGKIVLARAGPHTRAVKWANAVERGAVALITYNDPKEDGFWLGRPYPRGPMRPPHAVERGGVRDDKYYTGDLLSPGWPSKRGTRRLTIAESKGLSPIPVLTISYADASALFDALEGPVVPNDSWKGALGLTYHVGPSKVKARVRVKSEWKSRPLYNVIARIPGASHPDEWVIAGNHHDAWVFGADDPLGAAAALMETARSLATLRTSGWQPARTLIFALWDGEEQGILGATEWAEDHADELRRKAVAYLNGDNYRRGIFTSSGSTMLEHFMREVARDTPDPATERSVLDLVVDRALSQGRTAADTVRVRERPFVLTPIGANTDYAPFTQHLGITSLHIAYRNTGRGTYHSAFDSFTYFDRFLDPGYKYGASQAGAFAIALMRLSDAPLLPWSYGDAARAWSGYARELHALTTAQPGAPDLAPLSTSIDRLRRAAERHDGALARAQSLGGAVLTKHGTALDSINGATFRSEQALLVPGGFPGRPWFANPISGPSTYNGSVARTFPTIREPLELRAWDQARIALEATTAAIDRLTERVNTIATMLDAVR